MRRKSFPNVSPSSIVPTEDEEQTKLATWLTLNSIIFFAIPNGGSRNMLEAKKLKRCGVQSGVPDIFIPYPNETFHGLFVEMKRTKGSKVSDNQIYWLEFLHKKGYETYIAYGFDQAKDFIKNYFKLYKDFS